MSMKLLLAVVALGLLSIGCGTTRPKSFNVDANLVMYVERFEAHGNIQVTNLIAKFGTLSDRTVGTCDYNYDVHTKEDLDPPMITIDSNYWKIASDSEKEELMFHELGHCTLKREHLDTQRVDGCPVSYMNTFTTTATCLNRWQSQYRIELFSQK